MMKLKLKQVQRHQRFLKSLKERSSVKQVRAGIKKANFLQLRTLILVLAAIVLRQVPASEETASAFVKSRKKLALKTYFGSWKKVRALLKEKQPDRWRTVLLDLANLIRPAVGELV